MNKQNIIFGKNAVLEYLLSGKPLGTLYVRKGAEGVGKHIALAKQKGAVVKDRDAAKFDALIAGGYNNNDNNKTRHGNIALVIPEVEYSALEEILSVSKQKNTPPFIIMADEITDPHNLGALIRAAEAAGADGLIIPSRRSAEVNVTVHSSSAGAASHLKVCREANLSDVINRLKKLNIWIYGAAADGVLCYEQDFTGGVCFVIGSEGSGLRRLVRENCDVIISVPMYGKINSLNASVCGGILMYEAVRQRIMQK